MTEETWCSTVGGWAPVTRGTRFPVGLASSKADRKIQATDGHFEAFRLVLSGPPG